MQVFGIDVSKWQGSNFDFARAKNEGVQFVILRGAYSTNKDVCFEGFYNACKALKIPVGVYHYSMAKSVSEARTEANFIINNVLKGKTFEYPIYIDVEDKVQLALSKDLLTDVITTYCDTLQKAGYYVGIYSSSSFLSSYTHEDKLTKYDKWIAQWSKQCTYKGKYGMWQYGGETNFIRSIRVAGVVCDQNYCYVDYPTIIKEKGLNGYSKTNTVKPFKTVEQIAYEVIAGKWGNGTERKNKLSKAGYNYSEVQKKVNALLKTKKSVDEIAREVIAGKWGNGTDRKNRLEKAGYDYSEVQKKVNALLK